MNSPRAFEVSIHTRRLSNVSAPEDGRTPPDSPCDPGRFSNCRQTSHVSFVDVSHPFSRRGHEADGFSPPPPRTNPPPHVGGHNSPLALWIAVSRTPGTATTPLFECGSGFQSGVASALPPQSKSLARGRSLIDSTARDSGARN